MATNLTDPIYTDATKAREHLEAIHWPDGPVCRHCGSTEVTKLKGKSTRPGVYKCKDCRKPFTVTVGTIFERSKIPLNKWVLATHLLCASKKGMSAHQLHRMLGVTYKTAWFMAHRIREAMIDPAPSPMGGEGKTVEADETYIGKRSKPTRKAHFSNNIGWVPGSSIKTLRTVVTLVERGGEARSFHVDRANLKTIRNVLHTNVRKETELMTDEAPVYTAPGWRYKEHYTVKHSQDEYVRGSAHTNTIEGYFSIFKRGMKGIYQHCGEQHLQRYLTEFDFRYSNRKISDNERSERALAQSQGKRLTYRRTDETRNA